MHTPQIQCDCIYNIYTDLLLLLFGNSKGANMIIQLDLELKKKTTKLLLLQNYITHTCIHAYIAIKTPHTSQVYFQDDE